MIQNQEDVIAKEYALTLNQITDMKREALSFILSQFHDNQHGQLAQFYCDLVDQNQGNTVQHVDAFLVKQDTKKFGILEEMRNGYGINKQDDFIKVEAHRTPVITAVIKKADEQKEDGLLSLLKTAACLLAQAVRDAQDKEIAQDKQDYIIKSACNAYFTVMDNIDVTNHLCVTSEEKTAYRPVISSMINNLTVLGGCISKWRPITRQGGYLPTLDLAISDGNKRLEYLGRSGEEDKEEKDEIEGDPVDREENFGSTAGSAATALPRRKPLAPSAPSLPQPENQDHPTLPSAPPQPNPPPSAPPLSPRNKT